VGEGSFFWGAQKSAGPARAALDLQRISHRGRKFLTETTEKTPDYLHVNLSLDNGDDVRVALGCEAGLDPTSHIRDHFDNRRPIDLDRVWQMYAKAGYKGYLPLEYEGREDVMTAAPKMIQQMKALSKKFSTV
jgi:hypothetical protein